MPYGKVNALKQIRTASITWVKDTAQQLEKNALFTFWDRNILSRKPEKKAAAAPLPSVNFIRRDSVTAKDLV